MNNTGATGTVTLARGSGTGTLGGTTSGTIAVGASAVTISGVTYSKAESGVTVTATGEGASSLVDGKTGTSASFAVTAGAATQYGVTLSSSTPTAGGNVTVTAQLQDANGNAVATAGKTVTWSTTATGGSFAPATSTTDASGIATVDYTVSQVAGVTGTITATDDTTPTSLTGTSASFSTQAGAATKLQVLLPGETAAPGSVTGKTGTPTDDVAGSGITATVNAVDAYWNVVNDQTQTIAITSSDGAATLPANAQLVSGTKDFSVMLKTAGSQTITATVASGTSLTAGTSASVTVNPGTAAKLAFTVDPSNVVAGVAISPAVQVTVQDAYDNTVTGATDSITLAIGTNPGSGTLSGTVVKSAENGVASVADLSINKSGTGYTLTASASNLTGATSATFDVSAATAASIAVNAGDNQTATVGTSVSTLPSVLVTDAFGNAVQGTAVTFAVASGGGTLASSGSATTNSSGIATSPAWTLGTTAGSNTLTATSGSLTGSPVTFTATGTASTADAAQSTLSASASSVT
ncbi:MAG TPA: hypothetical protein VIG24_17275, partial [Acidimicrobiia bacterium]